MAQYDMTGRDIMETPTSTSLYRNGTSQVPPQLPSFLETLHHDVRFQIYGQIMSNTDSIRTYNILHPDVEVFPDVYPFCPVSTLAETNSFIRRDLDSWASYNKSWVMSNGNQFHKISDVDTKFVLKWPRNGDISSLPAESLQRWHQFCYRKPFPFHARHLVIEIERDFDDSLYADGNFGRQYSEKLERLFLAEMLNTLAEIFDVARRIEYPGEDRAPK